MELRTTRQMRRNEQLSKTMAKRAETADAPAQSKPAQPQPPADKLSVSRQALAWLEEQPGLWPAFTLLWTLKEARAKESGRGLTTSIRDIRVPLPEPGPLEMDGLRFRIWTGPGWAAAVCGHSEPPEKIFEKSLDIPTV